MIGKVSLLVSDELLIVLVLDFGGQIIADFAEIADLVLDDEGDLRAHRQGDRRGQAAGLGEHVQVPAGEGEGDGLLHLDGDGLLLLVDVGGLGQLDVAGADVAGRGELDALLGAGDHHALAKLAQVLDDPLELGGWHLDHGGVVSFGDA